MTLASQRGEGKPGKSVERVGEVGGVGIRPTEGWPRRNAACRQDGQSSWILEASPPCPLGTPAPSTLPAASATCFYFFPISLVQLIPPHQHKPVCQMPPLALVKRVCEGRRRGHICLGPWAGGRLGERTAEPRTHQPIVSMPVWVWSSVHAGHSLHVASWARSLAQGATPAPCLEKKGAQRRGRRVAREQLERETA